MKVIFGIVGVTLLVLSVIAFPWLWVVILIVGLGASTLWGILRFTGKAAVSIARPQNEAQRRSRTALAWIIGLPAATFGLGISILIAYYAFHPDAAPEPAAAPAPATTSAQAQAQPAHKVKLAAQAPPVPKPQPAAGIESHADDDRVFPADPESVPQEILVQDPAQLQEIEAGFKKNPPEWVKAKPVSMVPGAVICRSISDVQDVFSLYQSSFAERLQANLTHGQSELMNGPASAPPNPTDFGCVLAKPRTWLQVRMSGGIPIVSARLSNGNRLVGVTLWDMLDRGALVQP